MKITKIEVQKKNNDRVNIFIDDAFAFSCSTELVYYHSLKNGKVIELSQLQKLVDEDNYIKCKSYALKYIEKAYKTEKQIADKLIEKDYPEEVVRKTIDFLKEYKFIDDDNFLQTYIIDNESKFGKKKIKYNLLRKGINEAVVANALEKITSASEEESCQRIAAKKYDSIRNSDASYMKVYKKLGDFLMRNGYSSVIVSDTLKLIVKKDDFFEESHDEEKNNNSYEELFILAQKRYNLLIGKEKDKMKLLKKLYDYLMRRGYSYDEVKIVVKEIINTD